MMARIFITGSSDGIGSIAAQKLVSLGHKVVLHARNEQRAADAAAACPGAETVLVGDLSSIEETKALAAEADAHGPYDAVIHNAGVHTSMEKVPGKSGLPTLFTVNTLAPYILTCLMKQPKSLLFISSGAHYNGKAKLESEAKLQATSYSDSKLHNVLLGNAFARRWEGVMSNSADPGWVPTKMGGRGAPDSMDDAVDTFVLLSLAEGAAAGKTGTYWRSSKQATPLPAAETVALQDKLLELLGKISGVPVPST